MSRPPNYSVKPPVSQISEIEYSYRLKRAIEGYERRGLVYTIEPDPNNPAAKPNSMDIQELLTIRYKQKFPDKVTTNVAGIYRIMLPKADMFEFDNGELDSKHKVKQALIYGINEYVDSPDFEEGPVGYHTTIGSYSVPILRYTKHDNMGNPISESAQLMKRKNIFYIEYTPEKITEILDQMNNQPNTTAVAVGEEFGTTRFKEPSFAVHNFDEFKNAQDIEALMEASAKGFLRHEYGGLQEYMDAREESKKTSKPIRKKQQE